MPKKQNNYESARVLHAKGLQLSEIATKLGLRYDALQKHARRHKWAETNEKAVQQLSESVRADAAAEHTATVLALKNQGLAILGEQFKPGAKAAQIESAFRSLDVGDKIGRRGLGLDTPEHSGPQGVVQVVFPEGCIFRVKQHPNTIDLEAEPARKPQP